MSENKLISQFISEVRQRMMDHAEGSMLRPKHDLFELGESSGVYQGLNISLQILDSILSDDLEKEKQS